VHDCQQILVGPIEEVKCSSEVLDRNCRVLVFDEPPNGLGFSGGAPIDWESGRVDSSLQKATILRAQSAVRCKPLFGGGRFSCGRRILLLCTAG